MSEEPSKHYQVQITEVNLYVRKMTVADFVLFSIETTLLKTPAIYNYFEVSSRFFLLQLVCKAGEKKTILPKSQFVEWFWQ